MVAASRHGEDRLSGSRYMLAPPSPRARGAAAGRCHWDASKALLGAVRKCRLHYLSSKNTEWVRVGLFSRVSNIEVLKLQF
jgi:hypothetical protein